MKKVAVYKDRVAIQLPNRVALYQLDPNAGELDMQYHSTAKINKKLECNLLVVTSQHIVLCQVMSGPSKNSTIKLQQGSIWELGAEDEGCWSGTLGIITVGRHHSM